MRVPLALLALLTVLSLARPPQPPLSPRGIAHGLAAASLARDLDLRFAAADESRFRDLVVMRPMGVLLAQQAGSDVAFFPGCTLAAAYVAPFVAIGGLRGALFAHALALAMAMALAAVTLRQRLEGGWRILLTCLFGSVVVAFLMEPRPEVLTLAAVVAAFALAYRGETPRFEELAEVFDDRTVARRASFTGRWLAIGGLLAFAVLSHPLYILLVVAAATALPETSRRLGLVALGLGAAAMIGLSLGLSLLAGAGLPWVAPLGIFSAASGFPGLGAEWSDGIVVATPLSSAHPVADLSLTGWNLLYLAIGRSVGVLPYFLPVLLLLALWEPRARRSVLVMTAALAAIVTVILWPFDFAGDGVGLGNALLLPVFGALWLVPTRRCPAWAPAVFLLAAAALLWPTWLQTIGLWSGGSFPGATVSPLASRWLPHETTRRPLSGEYVMQTDVSVLPAGGGVSERSGRLFLAGGSWGSIALASPQPLSRVYLAFDGQAGSELDVSGGHLGNTLFGGDGRVGFEVILDGRGRRHSIWWSSEPQSLYDLRLRLPKAPHVPVAFAVEGDP